MTKTKNIILIYRDERFSPHSVEKDKAILDSVGMELQLAGAQVGFVAESSLGTQHHADAFLSMGRLKTTLAFLRQQEAEGATVINSSRGVEGNTRTALDHVLRQYNLPAAPQVRVDALPENDAHAYWLKCDDVRSHANAPVVCVHRAGQLRQQLAAFHQQGWAQVVVTEHVEGELVKFYGVQGTGFFRFFRPAISEGGAERHGKSAGSTPHFAFDIEQLRQHAEHLSRLMDVKIYGGDCIVRQDGSYAIIDFNDWPSFSCCRSEAAKVIASLVMNGEPAV